MVSALEALRNALYKFKTYLLTVCHQLLTKVNAVIILVFFLANVTDSPDY